MADPIGAGKRQPICRYRVRQACFVGGSYIDPKGRDDVFIMAEVGLEGPALTIDHGVVVPPPAVSPPDIVGGIRSALTARFAALPSAALEFETIADVLQVLLVVGSRDVLAERDIAALEAAGAEAAAAAIRDDLQAQIDDKWGDDRIALP